MGFWLLLGILFLLVFLVPLALLFAVVNLGLIGVCLARNEKAPLHNPSNIYFEKRNYISWSARHGWPRASHLRYECGICHKTLPSESTESLTCGCGNVFIGPEHIGAQDATKVLLYEEPA